LAGLYFVKKLHKTHHTSCLSIIFSELNTPLSPFRKLITDLMWKIWLFQRVNAWQQLKQNILIKISIINADY